MRQLKAMCAERRCCAARRTVTLDSLLIESRGHPASRRWSIGGRNRGQALIETLVFVLAAIIVMTCVLMLGRLQSIQTSTIGAARALAFECRLESAGCDAPERIEELAAVIRNRHFIGAERSSAQSAFQPAVGSLARSAHPFWANPDRQAMIDSLASIDIRSTPGQLDAGIRVAAAGAATGLVSELLAGAVGPQRFGLDPKAGLRTATIDVPVSFSLSGAQGGTRSSPLSLRIRGRLAIIGDEWNASRSFGLEDASLQTRVARGSRLDPFREAALDVGYAFTRAALQTADALGLEPGASRLVSHELDVSIIPGDRRP